MALFEFSVQLEIWCATDPSGNYEPYGSMSIKFSNTSYNKNQIFTIWNILQPAYLTIPNSKSHFIEITHKFNDYENFGVSGDETLTFGGKVWESDTGTDTYLGSYDGEIIPATSIFNKDLVKEYPSASGRAVSYVKLKMRLSKKSQ